MQARRALQLFLIVLAPACRSASHDLRVRVADLEDRRVVRADAWESLLTRGNEDVRASAARSVGRVRDPALAPPLLRALHVESSDAVRVEQLFALGQIADPSAMTPLLEALGSSSPAQRAAAAEAIGKLGMRDVASNLVAHLVDPVPAVRGASLLALARLVGRRSAAASAAATTGGAPLDGESTTVFLQVVPSLLADADASIRWKAAYALSEIEVDGRAPLLQTAASAGDELVRFFATSGLARLPSGSAIDLDVVRARLADANVFVAASAAAALGRHGTVEDRAKLESAARAPRGPASFHLQRAAIEARRRLATRLGETWPAIPSPPLPGRFGRVEEIRAMAAAADPATLEELIRLSADADAYVASEAILALERLAPRKEDDDASATSRRARLVQLARERCKADDVAVAGSALELLKTVGTADDLALVAATFDRQSGVDHVEARTTAVRVAAALAGASSIELLRRARADDSPAVVAAAKDEWSKLGLPDEPPPPRRRSGVPGGDQEGGGPRSSIELEPGVDFLSDEPNPRIVLRFAKGDVTIELLREEAPRHVKMLLERVRAGECDGLPIHRVVTGFVVQGLDPRGDGWGTGGVFLRDEIHRVPYERGALGMPNAGPDSGGCQIFVTHVPTPHLDGRYTVFGRVVAGMDVIDALDVGDVCTKAEAVR